MVLQRKIGEHGWWLISLAFVLIVVLLGWAQLDSRAREQRERDVLVQLCDVRSWQVLAISTYADRMTELEQGNRFIDPQLRADRVAAYAKLVTDLRDTEAEADCETIARASAAGR